MPIRIPTDKSRPLDPSFLSNFYFMTKSSNTKIHQKSSSYSLSVTTIMLAGCVSLIPCIQAERTPDEPPGIFLTWQSDPTTTMTIDWHTSPEYRGASKIQFKEAGVGEWQIADASEHPYAHSSHWSDEENAEIGAWTVHRVELTGLKPRTEYRFKIDGFEREYSFETIQECIVGDPLVFGAGGDNGFREGFINVNNAAMQHGIQFVAIGGDMAYEDGRADRFDRMQKWFEIVRDTLITKEGRVIPVVVGIGNHEMLRPRGGNFYYNFPEFSSAGEFADFEGDIEQWRVDNAAYFFSLFAFPGQPGYGVLDFGDYMSLIMLDTDHANPVGGQQLAWLNEVLAERHARGVTHILPKYHVPGYTSNRDFDALTSTNVREKWMPLFEKHGVRVAFENHDHTQKRTYPLRGGEIDHQDGIVYLGDGSWGMNPRESNNEWYLEHFTSERHAIIVTLSEHSIHCLMVNDNNEVIDEYSVVVKN